MSALGWALGAGCCVVCGIIGWTLHGLVEEIRQYRREADRG